MIQIGLDETFFFQLILFLIVVFVSNKLILKPMKKVIDSRDGKISAMQESVANIFNILDKESKEYEEKLSTSRKELSEHAETLRSNTLAKIDAMILSTKDEISADHAKHLIELEKMVKTTKESLKKDIPEMSKTICVQLSKFS